MIRLVSTEAELDALQRVCERLSGFDHRVSLEWLDGALCALMAGPSVPPNVEAALEPLLGDAWARTFGDPDDAGQALAALAARWRVLRSQLDPDALVEEWGAPRLEPLLLVPVDDGAAQGAAEGAGDAAPAPDGGSDAADAIPLGADWGAGFLHVVADPAWGWSQAVPDDDYERALADVAALLPAADGAGGAASTAEREALVDAAAFAAQDLRLWWIDHAPRTAPRRADPTPGRNDPCPCGSGRKFKKCHGAG